MIIYFVAFNIAIATAETLKIPNSVTIAVLANMELELKCETEDEHINWNFIDINGTQSPLIREDAVVPKLSSWAVTLEGNPPGQILRIGSIERKYAGSYTCVRLRAGDLLGETQVVVLDSSPVCNIKTRREDLDVVDLQCSVNYSGSWRPIMEWLRNGEKILDGVTINPTESNSVTSTLSVKRLEADSRSNYSCRTFFTENSYQTKSADDSKNQASNVPEYSFLWMPTGPKTIKITPERHSFSTSDVITCSANGDELITYKWINTLTSETVEGHQLSLSDKKHDSYEYQCTADNGVGNPAEASISFTVGPENHDNANNATMWILTGFAVVACFVVLSLIVIFIRKNPQVCRKTAGPDLLPHHAEVVQNDIQANRQIENRVDQYQHPRVPAPALVAAAAAGPCPPPPPPDINDIPHHNQNAVYAEVMVLDRAPGLPSYMQDSPAWNNSIAIQDERQCRGSPAWNHRSVERLDTPRNASPMVACGENIEYLDINAVARIPVPSTPKRPPARLPQQHMYHMVEYASIDHTSRPPPPPPPPEDDDREDE